MRQYRGAGGEECVWYEEDEIERMMEAELRKSDLSPTSAAPVVDLEKFIARHLKAKLDQYADLDPTVLGVTEFFTGGAPKVSINRVLTGSALDEDETQPGILGRWRATLAHEAAHIVLHRFLYEFAAGNLSLFDREPADGGARQRLLRCLKRNLSYGNVSDWREVQANKGMAALLMPRRVFSEMARVEIDTAYPATKAIPTEGDEQIVAKLAAAFQVSRQAARIRLSTLRLVSPPGQGQL